MTHELPPRAAYNLWAPSYAQSGRNPLSDTAFAALTELLPALSGRQVLDVACGDGRWSRFAVESGAATVVGVDFSPAMLRAARQNEAAPPLVAADMRALPFGDATFDVVIHALALSHARTPDGTLAECARVLRPGGYLAVVDLHPAATRHGWQRTFRGADGQRRAVRFHAHPLPVVRRACSRAGLRVARLTIRMIAPASLPANAPSGAGVGPVVYALLARRALPLRAAGEVAI